MKCKTHNLKLVKRKNLTDEQAWCGEWYDCPVCHYSVLIPSAELKAIGLSGAQAQRIGKQAAKMAMMDFALC